MPKFFIKIKGSKVLLIVALVYAVKIALFMPTHGASLPFSQILKENVILFAYGIGGALLILHKLIKIEREAVDTALCFAFNVHLALVLLVIFLNVILGVITSITVGPSPSPLAKSYGGGVVFLFNVLPFILALLILVLSFRPMANSSNER